MIKKRCLYCNEPMTGRKDKKYCSYHCARKYNRHIPHERECPVCKTIFPIVKGGANRKYCSHKCSRKASKKQEKSWIENHPEARPGYNKTRLAKNPGMWVEKSRAERLAILRLLGGQCVVCSVDNANWLHVDYIPTTVGKPYRHPRHLKYIREHLSDFRLLCANHHYELTLTGQIEGSDIKQVNNVGT